MELLAHLALLIVIITIVALLALVAVPCFRRPQGCCSLSASLSCAVGRSDSPSNQTPVTWQAEPWNLEMLAAGAHDSTPAQPTTMPAPSLGAKRQPWPLRFYLWSSMRALVDRPDLPCAAVLKDTHLPDTVERHDRTTKLQSCGLPKAEQRPLNLTENSISVDVIQICPDHRSARETKLSASNHHWDSTEPAGCRSPVTNHTQEQ